MRTQRGYDVGLPHTARIHRWRVLHHCCVAITSILFAAVEFHGPRYVAEKKIMIPAGEILIWCLPIEVEAVIHAVRSCVIPVVLDPSVIRNGVGVQIA